MVKHRADNNYYALPGGHLEYGEDIRDCMTRELNEELGIKPVLGKLLYVHNYKEGRESIDNMQSVEFFFEIENGKDYEKCGDLVRSHAHELAEIRWVDKNENINILPKQIEIDFKKENLLSDEVRFTEL